MTKTLMMHQQQQQMPNVASGTNSLSSGVVTNNLNIGNNNNFNHHHLGGAGNFGGFGNLGGSANNSGAPLVIDQLEWKDTYRHVFANLPLVFFHILSLLITFFLVFIAIADRQAMSKTWYLLLEGVMVLFFTFEIVSRYVLSRSVFGSYFQNRTNLVEALVCGICFLMFFVLLFSKIRNKAAFGTKSNAEMEKNLPHYAREETHREEAEHELVVVIRFAAQLFRGVLYLRNVMRAKRDNETEGGLNQIGGLSMHGRVGGGVTNSLV